MHCKCRSAVAPPKSAVRSRMSRFTFPVLAVVVTLGACSPIVNSGRFGAMPLPPTSGDIALYSTKLPTCAYDDVGLVHVARRHGFMNLQTMMDALRERAREMG